MRSRVTIVALVANVALFALKLWGFLVSGSIALFSDAMNSLLDIASSGAVLVSVRVARKAPDREHPFGHSRAEPIAGFVVAVVGCVIGVEVVQASIVKFLRYHDHEVGTPLFVILGIAIVAKLLLGTWQRRVGEMERSPALVASSVDSRNDVLASTAAMIGIAGAAAGFNQADEIAGLIVGGFILRGAIAILRENIDYLLGRASSDDLRRSIMHRIEDLDGVDEVRFCRGHLVGNEHHFEIIITCDGSLSTTQSAAIADRARVVAEEHADVAVAFVHVDVVGGPHHYPELTARLGG